MSPQRHAGSRLRRGDTRQPGRQINSAEMVGWPPDGGDDPGDTGSGPEQVHPALSDPSLRYSHSSWTHKLYEERSLRQGHDPLAVNRELEKFRRTPPPRRVDPKTGKEVGP